MRNPFRHSGRSLIPVLAILTIPLSCAKEDAFCIEDFSTPIDAQTGTVSFLLPDGSVHSGAGALPAPFTIGKYTGTLQSVILSQTPVGVGQEAELIHYFSDGEGNAFWTNDKTVLFPLDSTGARSKLLNVSQVAGGMGDFECAKGQFINDGQVDFISGKITGTMTGRLCNGCD